MLAQLPWRATKKAWIWRATKKAKVLFLFVGVCSDPAFSPVLLNQGRHPGSASRGFQKLEKQEASSQAPSQSLSILLCSLVIALPWPLIHRNLRAGFLSKVGDRCLGLRWSDFSVHAWCVANVS